MKRRASLLLNAAWVAVFVIGNIKISDLRHARTVLSETKGDGDE